ncbi:MAG: hypothetical protein J6W86_04075 [Bacteroidales bacterium]|jgi:hypothetical protein|nr:hypothetical protein [Bacteroidales bacterium]
MEEKKGLLSALAETLKQYELNQADNKDSLAIALEEKLEEIAKMISSLSDRIDHLSSRLNSIDDKVDALSQTQDEEPILSADETSPIPEPVFDSLVDNSFEEDEEEFSVEETESEEAVEEEGDESDENPEEVSEEEDAEPEEVEIKEEEAENTVEEKPVKSVAEKKGKDWYDWEYDYPQEYVDDILGTMGINDKLEFVRELFHSDPALFNSQMTEIDSMPNFKAIVQFFRQAHPEWKEDSDTVYRLYMHIRRKFRN